MKVNLLLVRLKLQKALTDNKNRTASNVRAIFGKRGGAMGESGSVVFNFERIGYIQYPLSVASGDEMFEAALEAVTEVLPVTLGIETAVPALATATAVPAVALEAVVEPETPVTESVEGVTEEITLVAAPAGVIEVVTILLVAPG